MFGGLIQQFPGVTPSSILFLVLSINATVDSSIATVRNALASVEDMAIRGLPNDGLRVNVGIGSNAWYSVTGGAPRPDELHPFQELKGKHTATFTPGDILFHVKAGRHDLIYEFEREVMDAMGDAVYVQDMEYAFPCFDARNLQEFVEGIANPVDPELAEAVYVTVTDDKFGAGGSYAITQRYSINLAAWNMLSTEDQQKQMSHRELTTIAVNGTEHHVFRDALPIGSPSKGNFGHYFIAYSGRLWVRERILTNMFIGVPKGKYDRLLDFATAHTGSVFFPPSLGFLKGLSD